MSQMSVYGPVPSRRLGRSLGINNIPPKTCSYSCVYCQLGRTSDMVVERKEYFDPEEVEERVAARVAEVEGKGERVDYLSFVPDGEPTLDINLGAEIAMLGEMGIPIAVITNASTIADSGVRKELCSADLVSVKIDSLDPTIWRKINRPHRSLSLEAILDGIGIFAEEFEGTLLTETMLLHGFGQAMEDVASFVSDLGVDRSYISVPTRPPAESTVRRPDERSLLDAYRAFRSKRIEVELLAGFEGSDFFTGDLFNDILAITSVHPMREDAIREVLTRRGESWEPVDSLVREGKLLELEHEGHHFYIRSFKR